MLMILAAITKSSHVITGCGDEHKLCALNFVVCQREFNQIRQDCFEAAAVWAHKYYFSSHTKKKKNPIIIPMSVRLDQEEEADLQRQQ